jgi:hypothetical protein
MKPYDVWKSADGRMCARPAEKAFVDDSDAPYGFDKHEVRVEAKNRSDALRKAKKGG